LKLKIEKKIENKTKQKKIEEEAYLAEAHQICPSASPLEPREHTVSVLGCQAGPTRQRRAIIFLLSPRVDSTMGQPHRRATFDDDHGEPDRRRQ
jgi:hypothetical protein